MSLTPSDPRISLRPVSLLGTDGTGGDLPFLRDLYASTRREEMATTGWAQAQVEAFLTQQFEAQHAHYMANYPGADFNLILFNEQIENPKSKIEDHPIGRLYLHERDSETGVVDIALLPEWRRRGIGGRLMRDIVDLGRKRGRKVVIYVEYNNPAMGLYHRLGFRKADTHGIYHLMEWAAPSPAVV